MSEIYDAAREVASELLELNSEARALRREIQDLGMMLRIGLELMLLKNGQQAYSEALKRAANLRYDLVEELLRAHHDTTEKDKRPAAADSTDDQRAAIEQSNAGKYCPPADQVDG